MMFAFPLVMLLACQAVVQIWLSAVFGVNLAMSRVFGSIHLKVQSY